MTVNIYNTDVALMEIYNFYDGSNNGWTMADHLLAPTYIYIYDDDNTNLYRQFFLSISELNRYDKKYPLYWYNYLDVIESGFFEQKMKYD